MSDAIDATCQGCGDPVGPGDLQLSHGRWIHHLCYMSDEELTAHQQAEIEALRAKLADCQAVIRRRGHDADCPSSSSACAICGLHEFLHPCVTYFGDGQNHQFTRGPCSEACGHDRTTAPSHPPAAT